MLASQMEPGSWVLAALLPIQLPGDGSGKAEEDDPSVWGPISHMGDLGVAPLGFSLAWC